MVEGAGNRSWIFQKFKSAYGSLAGQVDWVQKYLRGVLGEKGRVTGGRIRGWARKQLYTVHPC